MDTSAIAEAVAQEFERERAELLQRAEERPTLQMVNADQPLPIAEWQELYPERWLLIEVTKEDFSQIYEGKLIATAENSVEFLHLDKTGLVTLTTYGATTNDDDVGIVATPFVVNDEDF